MSSSPWSDLPVDIGHLILDRLTEVVEHVRFGATCNHWYVISKQYQHRQRRALPMLLVPSPEAPAKPDLPKLCALSWLGKYHQNFNHPLPFTRFRYCGSSNGWLATQNEDFTLTLLYPFAGQLLTIHLPVLGGPWLARKHDFLTKKLIVSPTSTPDNFTVVAIYGDARKLATIKSGEMSWFRFKKIPDIFYSDIMFYENKIYAVGQNFQMVRLIVHLRPPRFKIIHPGVESVKSNKTFFVESSSSELFLLQKHLRFLPVNQDIREQAMNQGHRDGEEEDYIYARRWTAKEFCVYKLKLDNTGAVVEIIETKSLNGDAFFVGDNESMSFSATCFPECKTNYIYFTDNYIYDDYIEPFGREDVMCYNVEDGSMKSIYSVIPRHRRNMSQPIWIMPQYYHQDKLNEN
uniref:KIB1-4 beta-propeller domain-containing protein n=1 Tax=Kalanchoe fedtschenkoi TaxID=63787 RepID=A0A7N0T6Y0_KALFE